MLKPHVKYHIGNGKAVNCMFDNWSSNGVIANFLSASSISGLHMLRTDSVADFMAKVRWPRGRRLTEDVIMCQNSMPSRLEETDDHIIWYGSREHRTGVV
ncbi:hypothetical protein LIER_35524 [Lithospermum erythrorhizon]|uniref:Uncharacterized protein n=1 Tax=Lithospermum erythrorhizon TaxID=34254 RepID=A0AAV3NRX7_LITER